MAISKRSKLVSGGLGAIVVFAIACGGDDGGKKSEGDAGTGGNTVPQAGAVGTQCTTDDQCKGAKCSQTQGLGGLSDLGSLLGIQAQPAPGGYCTAQCSTSADCGEGAVCLGALGGLLKGECRKACTASTAATDCRPGYECAVQQDLPTDAGLPTTITMNKLPSQCQAKPAAQTLTGQVGVPCTTPTDGGVATECGNGYCGGGACTATCSTSDDSTCGTGGTCVGPNFYGTAGTCQQSCTKDSECKGYGPNKTVGCVQAYNKSICGAKEYPLAAGESGLPCAKDSDCGVTGQCAAALGLPQMEAPGGYCSAYCTTDATCGTGGACIGTQVFGAGGCYKTCTTSSDCREGYTCRAGTNAAGDNVSYCTVGAAGGGRDAGTPPATTSDAGVPDAG